MVLYFSSFPFFRFFFYLANRPVLVLKCEQGFVGRKSSSSERLECNRANYETIQVEKGQHGTVFFKGESRTWMVNSNCSDKYYFGDSNSYFFCRKLIPSCIFRRIC